MKGRKHVSMSFLTPHILQKNLEIQEKKMKVPQQLWCWAHHQHYHHHGHILTTLLVILFISTITRPHLQQHVVEAATSGYGYGSAHRGDLNLYGASITWNATAMFVFGDSLEDTGNGLFCNLPRAWKLPFGMSFPGHGDGRFSDGRVLISDYLAGHLGLPPINPWLNVFLDFGHGANYAIPGGTALDLHIMDFPLPRQISLHLDLLYEALNRSMDSSSSSPAADRAAVRNDRKLLPSIDAIRDGLYAIQIGGLDYKAYIGTYKFDPADVVTQVVPLVVQQIRIALETLYNESQARNFLLVGVGAEGCHPAALFVYPDFLRDTHGCLAPQNEIARVHAQQLLALVNELGDLHPDATYTFLDLYGATLYVMDHADELGYSHPLDACCGAGPRYPFGYNSTAYFCTNATEALYVCPNPVNFISWDGSHYTQSFNFQVFNLTFVHGSFIHTAGAVGRGRLAGVNVSKSEAWA